MKSDFRSLQSLVLIRFWFETVFGVFHFRYFLLLLLLIPREGSLVFFKKLLFQYSDKWKSNLKSKLSTANFHTGVGGRDVSKASKLALTLRTQSLCCATHTVFSLDNNETFIHTNSFKN